LIRLTESQRLALEALERLNKQHPLVRTNELGAELWADRTSAYGYRGSNCSAPFARPAGKLLRSLAKLGLVEYCVWTGPEDWGWRMTLNGWRWLHPIEVVSHETSALDALAQNLAHLSRFSRRRDG
jgi:hypothetical protein